MMVYRRFDPNFARTVSYLALARHPPVRDLSERASTLARDDHGGTNDEETSVANTARPLSGFQRRMERSGSTVMLARR